MEAAARGPKTERTPLVGSVQFGGMPAHTSTDGLLNTSSNVILHFRLHSLERMSTINFALAICSLVYLAINIVMIVFNWTANFDGDCDDPDSLYIQRCGSPISEYGFHMMEFWATFGFAIPPVDRASFAAWTLAIAASEVSSVCVLKSPS